MQVSDSYSGNFFRSLSIPASTQIPSTRKSQALFSALNWLKFDSSFPTRRPDTKSRILMSSSPRSVARCLQAMRYSLRPRSGLEYRAVKSGRKWRCFVTSWQKAACT